MLFLLLWAAAASAQAGDAHHLLGKIITAYQAQRPFKCRVNYTFYSSGELKDSLSGDLYLQRDGYYLLSGEFVIVSERLVKLMVHHPSRSIQLSKVEQGVSTDDWLDLRRLDELMTSGQYIIASCTGSGGEPYLQLSSYATGQDILLYYDRAYLLQRIEVNAAYTDSNGQDPARVQESLLVRYEQYKRLKDNELKQLREYVVPGKDNRYRPGFKTDGYTLIQ